MNPTPQSVLIVGLGGGTIPRALRELLPETQIDVVEIDPAVVRVAQPLFRISPQTSADARHRDATDVCT